MVFSWIFCCTTETSFCKPWNCLYNQFISQLFLFCVSQNMRLRCTVSRSYLYHYFYNVVLAGFVNSAQINECNTFIKSDFKEDSGIRPDFHFLNALLFISVKACCILCCLTCRRRAAPLCLPSSTGCRPNRPHPPITRPTSSPQASKTLWTRMELAATGRLTQVCMCHTFLSQTISFTLFFFFFF